MNKKRFMYLLTLILTISLFMVLPVYAAEDIGRVDIKVDVPKGFNHDIFVQLQKADSYDPMYEEGYITLSSKNNYSTSGEYPAGEYVISSAFVSDDYSYQVTYLGNSKDAITISAGANNVQSLQFKCEAIAKEDLPEEDKYKNIINKDDTKDYKDKKSDIVKNDKSDDSEEGFSPFIVRTIFTALIFLGLGIFYIIRKKMQK